MLTISKYVRDSLIDFYLYYVICTCVGSYAVEERHNRVGRRGGERTIRDIENLLGSNLGKF